MQIDRKKIGKYIARLLTYPFLFLLYFFSHFFPRDKQLWIFGMPEKFALGSKYFFLHLVNSKEETVHPIWISRSRVLVRELQKKGYPTAFWLSFTGVWSALRARFYIVDASIETINYWLSGGAKEILLWHGIPIKKIEKDAVRGNSSEIIMQRSRGAVRFLFWFLFPWRFRKPDWIAATSPFFQKLFSRAFGVQEKNIAVSGFPQNDVLFGAIKGEEIGTDTEAIDRMRAFKALHQKGKIVMYAPTFRDTGGDSFFEKEENLEILDRFLQEQGILFLFKLHPLAKATEVQKRGVASNIVFVERKSDADPLLRETDILVTDYSSMHFEFVLLDRPMVFFPFDYEKYVAQDRELYFDYDEITPGPKVRTLGELMAAIKEIAAGKDEYKEQRKRIRDFAHTFQDGNASKRIFSLLKEK